MEEYAISLEKVSKTYHLWRNLRRVPREGVRDVSLAVRPGIVFGLLGLNGAGKTTTMRLLTGLLRPDRGRIEILGGKIEDPAVRSRIGYIPEMPYLPLQLSARSLLGRYGAMSGLAGRRLADRIEESLETASLKRAGREPISTFSKGMLQRVALAQALLHRPEVLFADEPMSGLDPEGIREMRELLLRLKNDGITVFLNSHQIAEVERVCDRAGVMARGRLVREGAVSELLAVAGARTYRLTFFARSAAGSQIEDVTVREEELEEALAARRKGGARLTQILAQAGSLEEVVLDEIRKNE